MILDLQELQSAFSFLDQQGFQECQRYPLVAARQWKWTWEAEAWRNFRQRQANVQEVAWPRFYWPNSSSKLGQLFYCLTLGNPVSEISQLAKLSCLFDQSTRPQCPRWTLVTRFGRYMLRSHPQDSGQDFVYFGDDTLFLMEACRQILAQSDPKASCLDLCCGGGGVSLSLPAFSGNLVGVDLNPVAIALAQAAASAQGLRNYQYLCQTADSVLNQPYDFIFGNPPTLSPTLTGHDVFYATAEADFFFDLLEKILLVLKPNGRGFFTFFSLREEQSDGVWSALAKLLKGQRPFACRLRREFPLGGQRFLRHSVLELLPQGESDSLETAPGTGGVQLPFLAWRR